MSPAENWVEVYLAGLRNGTPDWRAHEFQVELQEQSPVRGNTLREAIDNAMKKQKEPTS